MDAEDFDFLNDIGSIEASGWCNLWFLRDGRSYLGPVRFRSEDAATAMGIRWLKLATTGCVLMPDGSDVLGDFHHSLHSDAGRVIVSTISGDYCNMKEAVGMAVSRPGVRILALVMWTIGAGGFWLSIVLNPLQNAWPRALATAITMAGIVQYYLYAFHPGFWQRCRERLVPHARHKT
jgi:hypothetical protein